MATIARRCFSTIPYIACTLRQSQLFIPTSSGYNVLRKCPFTKEAPKLKKETVTIYFLHPDGRKTPATAKVGDSMLDVIIENDVDIDGYGACEGTLACSTCHLVFNKPNYDLIPDKHTDEELDMLDLAFDLCDTSRLGCQVIVTKQMNGWEIRVPSSVADARET